MHSVDTLREALAAETAGLAPQLTAEDIVHGGHRRQVRRRIVVVTFAATVLAAVAAPLAVWQVSADGGPVASGPPGLIRTGVATAGGEELVLWPSEEHVRWPPADGSGLPEPIRAGRRNPDTGRITEIEAPRPDFRLPDRFWLDGRPPRLTIPIWLGCYPVPGPDGTFIRVGSFIGSADKVTIRLGGAAPREARFVRSGIDRDLVVFWLAGLPSSRISDLTVTTGGSTFAFSNR